MHNINKFKYKNLKSLPHLNQKQHKINNKIFSSNYHTFINIINPLIKKLNKKHQQKKKTTLTLYNFNSINNKYKIPF